jgi:flagellar protein FlgJ
MDIPPLQPRINVSTLPFDQLAKNPNVSKADKVKEACRQFEAVLMRQILQEARKTVIHSSTHHDSNAAGIYDDMVNNQVADNITHSGGFGLAKSLQAQLVHQVLPGAAKASPANAVSSTIQHKSKP